MAQNELPKWWELILNKIIALLKWNHCIAFKKQIVWINENKQQTFILKQEKSVV